MRSSRASGLDAVTIDAFGTLVRLRDPVPGLRAALQERGVPATLADVDAAFRVEAAHYRPRSLRGRDEASLAELRRECTEIFLAELGRPLEPEDFTAAFVTAFEFELIDGAADALTRLRAGGLALACVANWDCALGEHLQRLGIRDAFTAVVTSAEAGAEKPSTAIFEAALERLGVPAGRAVHIGDSEVDREGAAAAGLEFEPVPLATLPGRLGL